LLFTVVWLFDRTLLSSLPVVARIEALAECALILTNEVERATIRTTYSLIADIPTNKAARAAEPPTLTNNFTGKRRRSSLSTNEAAKTFKDIRRLTVTNSTRVESTLFDIERDSFTDEDLVAKSTRMKTFLVNKLPAVKAVALSFLPTERDSLPDEPWVN
jgi:hypothetical protein